MFPYNQSTHKLPFGAVKPRESISICFPVYGYDIPNSVRLLLRKIDETEARPIQLHIRPDCINGYVYECTFTIDEVGVYLYRFEVEMSDGIHFIGRNERGGAERGDWLEEWQITVSTFERDSAPIKSGGIIYHIFLDRFCKVGDACFTKDGVLKDWDTPLDVHIDGVDYPANDYYGGNLKGVEKMLPYLFDLGVTALYFSPMFMANSNHRYDTADYMQIDDLLGTDADFFHLLATARGYGIGIILDGVFNHTGADSRYFNRFGRYSDIGAFQSRESKYYDWYSFSEFPEDYNCWWGMTCVPTLAKDSKSLREYLFGINGVIEKWTSTGILGWRFDVVDELPIDYTDELCSAVRRTNKNALIIGEVWEDASTKISYDIRRPYFFGNQLNGVMNYVFKALIIDFCMGGDVSKTVGGMCDILNNYPKACLDSCMTILDSHDTVRILNVLSGVVVEGSQMEKRSYQLDDEALVLAKSRLKMATAIQYVVSGIPTVYYGDEVGMQGFEDPLNRKPYPFGKEDLELLSHYKALGEFRNRFSTHLGGSMRVSCENGLLIIDRIITDKGEDVDTMPSGAFLSGTDSSVTADYLFETERVRLVCNNTPMSLVFYTTECLDILHDVMLEGSSTLKTNEYLLLFYSNRGV